MSKDDCSYNEGAAFISEDFKDSMRTEAKEIVKAWKDCINRFGSYASPIYGDDSNLFAIHLHTHFPTTNHGRAKISMRPKNAVQCDRTTATYDFETDIGCQRGDSTQNVIITVNFQGQSSTLSIPRIQTPPPAADAIRICRLTWGGTESPEGQDIGPKQVRVHIHRTRCGWIRH